MNKFAILSLILVSTQAFAITLPNDSEGGNIQEILAATLPNNLPASAQGEASPSADSRTYKLPNTAVALTPISGEVIDVRPLCPANARCITNGTVIQLKFMLHGCLDNLAPVSYEAIEKDGKLHVYVSAQNVHSSDSKSAFCFSAPIVSKPITLVGKYGEVEMHYLGASNN